MTATTIGEDGEVVVECGLDAPAERVWRALATPELAADWLDATWAAGRCDGDVPPDREPQPDGPNPGAKTFEIVEAEPFSRLTYRWREGRVESFVTVELSPRGAKSTWFRLVHRPPESRTAANGNTPMALAA
ncbi:SRPBCC family protein [Kumtagia ephedrae]|uniref:Activator of Hsp90 ATPase homologue 1/2-like C-terminal domain-containing protein n=1 Tax=Kumtagia ephedrae TaxID=2116701 RepID=A0A2P7SSZ6_9HYPH|nr:SRPBCC domain-containing protein [Mesorhizobium ephedrae]PSJ65571.1 hypothetical protein C7I84_00060 [Mesorhizobium ephedrae]